MYIFYIYNLFYVPMQDIKSMASTKRDKDIMSE